ncbi:MgtE intracellular N domain protein [Wolbachia endosymbiont of Bemisia tabaci]|uniref:magnesium transporter MgtE N-terminal domain-containing protein n=1 Tax=Wolbachia endosymbiont of Bemisia tabaci TaxID=215173 RepID=UPI000FD16779|nr:MgtE intracellular N domain protein [Wolbachia endosymbiont of Bemisia tabaci]AZU37609.1 MgtE intracellular N domain protein [Wolbachia endosymbiont of Bemisia tabaci]
MVPGEELSKGFGSSVYWPDFSRFQPVKKVKLVQLGKEDEAIELPIRLCGNNISRDGFYCIRGEEGNTLKSTLSRDKPGYSENNCAFVYYDYMLVKLSMESKFISREDGGLSLRNNVKSERSEHSYVTQEELDDTYKYYFSDYQGNIINSPDNQALQYIGLDVSEETIKDTLSKIPENIVLSKMFAKIFVEELTEDQLATLANTLRSDQIEDLVEHLTDNQWQALMSHFTNHQLRILVNELNQEKLGIIVPLLNKDQVVNLVKDLNLDQVREIFPHLKTDQFMEVFKTISDDQFVELIRNADEKSINTILDEALKDRLPILVKMLEGDKLHNLINKLDHEKLAIVARELTDDSDKIQMVVKSLANNPEKLKAFALSMSNEQFKELLDNVDAEELKDIIHKLPYEKVTAVIGDLGSKDQSNVTIEMLKKVLDEKFKECNEKQKEMMEILKKFEVVDESKVEWDSSPNFQDTKFELTEMEENVQIECVI